jgi:hypothetical protein
VPLNVVQEVCLVQEEEEVPLQLRIEKYRRVVVVIAIIDWSEAFRSGGWKISCEKNIN